MRRANAYIYPGLVAVIAACGARAVYGLHESLAAQLAPQRGRERRPDAADLSGGPQVALFEHMERLALGPAENGSDRGCAPYRSLAVVVFYRFLIDAVRRLRLSVHCNCGSCLGCGRRANGGLVDN